MSRRTLLAGSAATACLTPALLSMATFAHAQAADTIPTDKLMAKGELPDIAVGNKDAKVTIVEYASMTCPHCANFHTTVYPKLKEQYIDTGKVLFVMREFPLDLLAVAVSMLARCAGDEKAPAMISLYFETQDQWRTRDPVPKLLEISKQAGLTQEAFEKCLDNEDMRGKLARQRDKAAEEFGVSATPSFFINGKRMKGRLTMEAFAAEIDPLLKG